jgi:site-specific DNA recombinase
MKPDKSIKYDMYLRKSSEAEDKQVQSIDDQRRELREYAVRNDLNIIGEFEESQSAHHPGRPVFGDVMKRIEKGVSNGLLVWHANRVSRNPIDSGAIVHLIDEGKLIHVRTPSHTYGNTSSEKMMLALECMIAKKDSDDKSDAVKRGLRGRYKKGLPNGVAPIGFINDLSVEKGNRGWKVDAEKFAIIKQLLELFHSRKYSIRALLQIANEDMGLRTPQHRKQGGKKLVVSHFMETVLKNSVYAGFFFTKDGERHELNENVPRAISEEKYWEIQKILQNKGRPRPSKYKLAFAYTGPTTCGGCGGAVTAEHKYQVICDCKHKFPLSKRTHCPACGIAINRMKKPTHLHYIYYHCTRTKDRNCRQGSVQELYIDDALASYFRDNFAISKDLHQWCIENLKTVNEKDKQDDSEKKTSVETTLAKKQKEYKELVLMKTRGMIDDAEFLALKGPLKGEIEALEGTSGTKKPVDQKVLIQQAKRAFDLSLGIDDIFKSGTPQEKKELLRELQSNLTIKDKKLNVYNTGVYKKIIDWLVLAKSQNPSFEPRFYQANKGKTEVFSSVCPTLLPG